MYENTCACASVPLSFAPLVSLYLSTSPVRTIVTRSPAMYSRIKYYLKMQYITLLGNTGTGMQQLGVTPKSSSVGATSLPLSVHLYIVHAMCARAYMCARADEYGFVRFCASVCAALLPAASV